MHGPGCACCGAASRPTKRKCDIDYCRVTRVFSTSLSHIAMNESRRRRLRLIGGAASETVCEGSVIRSPAFLPPGHCSPGLRSLRGRSRPPRTDNRPDRGMAQGRLTADGTRADEAALGDAAHTARRRFASVAFPQPLRPDDVALMRRIFAFQAAATFRRRSEQRGPGRSAAAGHCAGGSLPGPLPSFRRWMNCPTGWSDYRDLPDAPAIHALLLTRLPKGARTPPAPDNRRPGPGLPSPIRCRTDIDPPRNDLARQPVLDRTVLDRAQRGEHGIRACA